MYKAIEDIGDYKKGDTVPDDKAMVWMEMYTVSPVELVTGTVLKNLEKPVEDPSNPMLDDYLGRNFFVVKSNIKKDNLPLATLEKLLILEKKDKKRSAIIELLEDQIEEVD